MSPMSKCPKCGQHLGCCDEAVKDVVEAADTLERIQNDAAAGMTFKRPMSAYCWSVQAMQVAQVAAAIYAAKPIRRVDQKAFPGDAVDDAIRILDEAEERLKARRESERS